MSSRLAKLKTLIIQVMKPIIKIKTMLNYETDIRTKKFCKNEIETAEKLRIYNN